VSEDPRRDVWLDLVAFVAAMRQHDEEGLRAVLDANLDCRWCMESLLRAAGFLLIRVLEDPPEGGIDEALAEVRRAVLEQF
jgi:hypothetical protein